MTGVTSMHADHSPRGGTTVSYTTWLPWMRGAPLKSTCVARSNEWRL